MFERFRSSKFTDKALAYVKAELPIDDCTPSISLSFEQSPVLRPFADGLCISYVVDDGTSYQFVQNRHLAEDRIDEAKLHDIGIRNLTELAANRNLRVQPYESIFAVLMNGDFEASMLLLDQVWDGGFRQFVAGEYAIAVPARDILAFCDSTSVDGLRQLQELIDRATTHCDHPISDKIYIRRNGNLTRLD
jgi:uncharacterized protein YtpQ (UPF0354 family)